MFRITNTLFYSLHIIEDFIAILKVGPVLSLY